MAMQLWGTSADGGYMYAPELSDFLRVALQPAVRFRNHCDAKDATDMGLHRGAIFYWNEYSDVATAGAALDENDTMTETKFTITQNSLTMTEYGNSVPFTQKLDNLSKHPVMDVISRVLKHDAKKVLDSAAHAQFDATLLYAAPTGGNSTTAAPITSTGSTAITNNVALKKAHVRHVVDQMKERNIPGYNDTEDYICIGRPTTFTGLKGELESVAQYTDEGYRKVVNGEIGKFENTRFVEQTNVASEGWSNGLSDAAYFFGGDTVVEAIAVPEEIRGKIPMDFGRDRAVAWYALLGFGIARTTAANSTIVKWGSAA